MRHSLASAVVKILFDRGLVMLAWMTRRRWLRPFAGALLVVSGRATNLFFGVRMQSNASAIGREWERTFPSKKIVRITEVVGDTAFGEIHVRCPLRGSGDVHACWRLMTYDRAIAKAAGASFVVLHSQAEPGRDYCRVALRATALPTADLRAAHERVDTACADTPDPAPAPPQKP